MFVFQRTRHAGPVRWSHPAPLQVSATNTTKWSENRWKWRNQQHRTKMTHLTAWVICTHVFLNLSVTGKLRPAVVVTRLIFTLRMQSFSFANNETSSHTQLTEQEGEEKRLFLTRFADVDPRTGELCRRRCSVAVDDSNRDEILPASKQTDMRRQEADRDRITVSQKNILKISKQQRFCYEPETTNATEQQPNCQSNCRETPSSLKMFLWNLGVINNTCPSHRKWCRPHSYGWNHRKSVFKGEICKIQKYKEPRISRVTAVTKLSAVISAVWLSVSNR